MTSADGPLLLCYDGSPGATHAIERAADLLAGRDALVLTIWQPTAQLGSFAWAGATESMVDFFAVDRAAADLGGRVAEEGVRIARAAGLDADGLAVEGAGPVWQSIVTVADDHQASMIVVGSGGFQASARCCWGASPVPCCITRTGPRWSSVEPASG